MSAKEVGTRPRWPDVVIAISIVVLAVVGVTALFGTSIRGWFYPASDSQTPARTPAGRTL